MVRPKPSLENLQISGAFAEAITVKLDTRSTINYVKVECRGSNSIFAAIKICLPHLTRMRSEPAKKGAVTEIQLNKYLAQIGFKQLRYRKRILGSSHKWTEGCHHWKNLRWIQVRNPYELQYLRHRLAEITARFPKKLNFQEDKLFAFLSSVSPLDGADESEQSKTAFGSAHPSVSTTPFDHDFKPAAGWSTRPATEEDLPLQQRFLLIPRRHPSTQRRSSSNDNPNQLFPSRPGFRQPGPSRPGFVAFPENSNRSDPHPAPAR
jgi:hypothetical protein